MPPSTSLPSPLAATFGSGWVSAPGVGANPSAVNGHRAGGESVSGSVLSREDRENDQDKDKEGVGLGLMVHEERTRRPAHLSLSPSDGALSDQAHIVNGDEDGVGVEEEDRGHVSEVRFSLPALPMVDLILVHS